MKSFSQRKGLKPVPEIAQIGGMNDELRNSLWNVMDNIFWSAPDFMFTQGGYEGDIERFSIKLWANYFKKPVDSRPGFPGQNRAHNTLQEIRRYFFQCDWNEVYDFLEFIVRGYASEKPTLVRLLNFVLERELAGYRFLDGNVVDITDAQELTALEEALVDTQFATVNAHLAQALRLLANRQQPDYRNSIKESISAVEAMARIAAKSPKATLGDALKLLERNGQLHPSLKDGFSKLYGYTNDGDGIRHAMLDKSAVDQSDAKYFLLSCTSFINYLKANLP